MFAFEESGGVDAIRPGLEDSTEGGNLLRGADSRLDEGEPVPAAHLPIRDVEASFFFRETVFLIIGFEGSDAVPKEDATGSVRDVW